jgi:hypothetical protein
MMKPEYITEWAKSEKERIDKFVAWWKENAVRDAAAFPAKMPGGEWDEQYRCWGE